MGFTPFGDRFKGFNAISSPIEAIRRYDPGTKYINQSPAAAAMMRGMLPVAGGIAGGALGGPVGAGVGAGAGTWGAEMGFGEGTEDERRRTGRDAGMRNAAAAVVLSSLFNAFGGEGVETPKGTATPTTGGTPSYRKDPFTGELSGGGGALIPITPAGGISSPSYRKDPFTGELSDQSYQPGVLPSTVTPRSATGGFPPMSISGGGGGGAPTVAAPTATTGGGGWGSAAKTWGPIVGLNLLSTWQQQRMMEDYQEAQEESYDKYLQGLNPPEETKEARFQGLKGGILKAAPAARKRRSSQMAARGIRGKGAAAPIAETETDVQDAINQAYFNIYGSYNVPGAAPPVKYTPTTGQMAGQQAGDLANLLTMYNLFGKGR